MALARTKARWRLRLCIVFGSFLLVFLAGEATIRIIIHYRVVSASRETAADDPSLPVLKGMFELGRKNVQGTHKGVFFRTNSQKLRGPEYQKVAEEDVFRIAIAGDSVTMGEGVEEAMTYSSRLAEMLDLPELDGRVEVLNVGLSGSNIEFAMRRLEKAVNFYHPDLIVYGFTINDIEGSRYEQPTRGTQELAEIQSSQWFSTSPSLLIRIAWWLLATSRIEDFGRRNWYAEELLFNYFDNPPALEDWKQGLKQFDRMATSEGICAHVLIHTHLNDLHDEHPYLPVYDLVAREAETLGLGVTQTFEQFFKGRAHLELWSNLFDPHPNAEGHEILARALAAGLARMPSHCWRRAGNVR